MTGSIALLIFVSHASTLKLIVPWYLGCGPCLHVFIQKIIPVRAGQARSQYKRLVTMFIRLEMLYGNLSMLHGKPQHNAMAS